MGKSRQIHKACPALPQAQSRLPTNSSTALYWKAVVITIIMHSDCPRLDFSPRLGGNLQELLQAEQISAQVACDLQIKLPQIASLEGYAQSKE